MNKKLAVILVSIGIILVALGFVMWHFFGQPLVEGDNPADGGQIATEVLEKTKDEITVQDFKEKLESIVDLQFYVKTTDDIRDSVYEGLNSTAIVKSDNVVVASLDVYDNEQNAQAVITDVMAGNTAGFDRKSGNNFESLSTKNAFVERVGKTVLSINTEDTNLIDAIRKAIQY